MFDRFPMTRRFHLGLWGGMAAAVSKVSPVTAASQPNLADPVIKLDAYVRLRCRTDGRPTFIQYQGTIFGKREGEKAAPLFGVTGASWSKATRKNQGCYQILMTEAGYFTDLSSGIVLDRWINPLNGVETTVKHYYTSQTQLVTADKIEPKLDLPAPTTGFEYSGTVPPALVIADQIWMYEDMLARIPSRPKESFEDPREYFGPFTTATSLASWTAPLSSVFDDRRPFVRCTFAYQTLGSWRPFMRMGSDPGLISWRMSGLKLERFEQVDATLRQRLLHSHPDFLKQI